MRLLYIHQYFGTPAGSGGTRSYEFAQRLIAAGHQVTMVCGAYGRSATGLSNPFDRGSRRGNVEGIDVIEYEIAHANADSIATRIGSFLRFGIASTRLALTGHYDLLFATSTPLTAGVPGIVAKLMRRKPFVFEVRDLWPALPKALGVRNPLLLFGMSCLEWLAYRCADRLIGLAPGIVEGIVARGVPRDRTTLIPNGCDLDLFDSAPAVHASHHLPSAIDPGDFVCIYSGAHGVANGLGAVIDAAAELRRRGFIGIKLLLIGSGATKAALVEQVADRGLAGYVVFSDPIPKTHLIPLLKGADAGLQMLLNLPAFYEGTSPNKFFDYLAAGTPVLVNYPGWIADLVKAHDAGTAIAPDDAVAFADAIENARNNRAKWERKRENARRLAGSTFSRDDLGRQFVDVIEATARTH